MFTDPFPSSGRLFLLIKICCLTANVVLLLISWALHKNGSIRHNVLYTLFLTFFGVYRHHEALLPYVPVIRILSN
jgi:hypothetical protein